jgi:hypothetical protein
MSLKVLAFNTHGAAHQYVHVFLSELSAKAQSRTPYPTAFNASNFICYATQRLSILVNIGTAGMIKKERVLSDPFTSFFPLVVSASKKKIGPSFQGRSITSFTWRSMITTSRNNYQEKKVQHQKQKHQIFKSTRKICIVIIIVLILFLLFYSAFGAIFPSSPKKKKPLF